MYKYVGFLSARSPFPYGPLCSGFHLEYKPGYSASVANTGRASGSGAHTAVVAGEQPQHHTPHRAGEDLVIQVPDSYAPSMSVTPSLASSSHRLSLDGTHPSTFSIHTTSSWGSNFVQLCCWAVTRGLAARAPQFTETDTAMALQDIITVSRKPGEVARVQKTALVFSTCVDAAMKAVAAIAEMTCASITSLRLSHSTRLLNFLFSASFLRFYRPSLASWRHMA